MLPEFWFSAGERSGDLHGAGVLSALYDRAWEGRGRGLGGSHLCEAGAHIDQRLEPLTTMGGAEILSKLPAHMLWYFRAIQLLADRPPQLVLPIDYPGFNLRFAARAKAMGIPVLYYVAPQMWAWGAKRVHQLKDAVTGLAVVLPFEKAFFDRFNIPTTFVGHPLLDLGVPVSQDASRRQLGLAVNAPVVALCPGSRPSEIRRIWPLLRNAARMIRRRVPEVQFALAGLDDLSYGDIDDLGLYYGDAYQCLAAADVALCKSGTVTLQAAMCGTPMVVTYKMHPLSHAIASHLVGVSFISLVNLIANRSVVPELIQTEATPDTLSRYVINLLDSDRLRATQQDDLEQVVSLLGTPGASDRVAQLALELANT